jgi:hypothetical protein
MDEPVGYKRRELEAEIIFAAKMGAGSAFKMAEIAIKILYSIAYHVSRIADTQEAEYRMKHPVEKA